MKLLTKELEKALPALYSQENVKLADQIAIVKFFDPMGSSNWYAIEYSPKQRIFFGYIEGDENEWGYFSLNELESISKKRILGIERDLYFKRTKMSDIIKGE
jgi:Protein of unknown function (DUF2958)